MLGGCFIEQKFLTQKHKNAKNVTLNRQRILVCGIRAEIRKNVASCKLGTFTSGDLDFSLLCMYPGRPQCPPGIDFKVINKF